MNILQNHTEDSVNEGINSETSPINQSSPLLADMNLTN